MIKDELAETANYSHHLNQLAIALDNFQHHDPGDALQRQAQWQTVLASPLPDQGAGLDSVVSLLCEQLIPNGSPSARPGFSSFITTGATTAAVLASTAASVAAPQRYHNTAFNFLEEQSLQWLCQLFKLDDMQGIYSSGGSVANLIALGAARQHAFEALGQDVASEGLNRPCAIYASDQCHHTIQRSAAVLGLGRQCVRQINSDANGCLIIDSLRLAIAQDIEEGILPVAIVANAGSTNTGAIDPLAEMGELAQCYNIWFHVDGAYGLPGILDQRITHLYNGMELADSIIVDPHKWLGASVGIAATFVKDRGLLQRAFTQEPADYLEGSIEQGLAEHTHCLDSFGIPYFDFGVELSSPSRGVVVWAMLNEIGRCGMVKRIERHCDMAKDLAAFATRHDNLELCATPVLSICCFRYVSPLIDDLNNFNQKLHRALVREDQYMPSTTVIQGIFCLRPCFIGARQDEQHVSGLVDAVLRLGAAMVEQQSRE